MLFEHVRAFEVAFLSAGDRLKFVINLNAEGEEEAAGARDDWSGLQGRLMNFHCKVKVREWVGAFSGVPFEELSFFFCERVEVFDCPVCKESRNDGLLSGNFGGGEVLIRVCIRQVVPKGELYVLVTFDDGWT